MQRTSNPQIAGSNPAAHIFDMKDKDKLSAKEIDELFDIIVTDGLYGSKEKSLAYSLLIANDNGAYTEFPAYFGVEISMPMIIYDVISYLKIYRGSQRAAAEMYAFYGDVISRDWIESFVKSNNIPEKNITAEEKDIMQKTIEKLIYKSIKKAKKNNGPDDMSIDMPDFHF